MLGIFKKLKIRTNKKKDPSNGGELMLAAANEDPRIVDACKQVTGEADNLKFVNDHIEYFRFLVKYQEVVEAVIANVSDKEIALLNTDCPCKYRTSSAIPFRAGCAARIDGEPDKKLTECEKCKFRQP